MKNLIILISLSFIISNSNVQSQAAPAQTPSALPAGAGSFAKSVGLYVFPAKSQAADVQSKDDADCYRWAVQQSNYDPINPPKVVPNQVNTAPTGQSVVGATKGAAAGLAIGSIGGEAGKGAAVGAIVGGLAGRRAKKEGDAKQQQANNQAAAAKSADLLNDFKKAFTVCLEGKGYTVK